LDIDIVKPDQQTANEMSVIDSWVS
jgi:hypothetical protein